MLEDEDGSRLMDEGRIERHVAKYWRSLFWNGDEEEVKMFEGCPKQLNVPISEEEIERAIKKGSWGRRLDLMGSHQT